MSAVRDAFARWISAEDDALAVSKLRRVLCVVMIVYDTVDLLTGSIDRALDWFPHPRDTSFMALHVGLIVSNLVLLSGRQTYLAGIASASLRFLETRLFPLNDFHFFTVATFMLAHERGLPFGEGPKNPKWVRDVLRWQAGYVYLATAWLKLGHAWISGGEMFVRTSYLKLGHDWPYPAFLARGLDDMTTCAVLSWIALGFEILLGILLLVGRPWWMAVALVLAIHSGGLYFGNVWFFTVVMISTVTILMLPSPKKAATSPSPGSPETPSRREPERSPAPET